MAVIRCCNSSNDIVSSASLIRASPNSVCNVKISLDGSTAASRFS